MLAETRPDGDRNVFRIWSVNLNLCEFVKSLGREGTSRPSVVLALPGLGGRLVGFAVAV